MKTIVLVHGAWADASCWDKLVPLLKSNGHEVIAVNLPGHGKDNTSFEKITLQSYVDAVKKAIGNRSDIILVGHSLGGMVISGVAEQIPGKIKELVYLCAFLPHNGETLLQLATLPENKESLLGKYFRPDEKSSSAGVAQEGILEFFAADTPKEDADNLLANLKADPLAPFATPVTLTDDNFGKTKKTYIYTIDDKAVGYSLQQFFVKNSNISKTYSLKSSHAPFFSVPGELAEIILKEAE
ncbi:MAG: alpha/beta fold hydrolase [bacterium]